MKKILLGALLPLLMLSSCSNNDEKESQNEKGTLVIKTKFMTEDIQVIPTRAETFNLFITIKNKTTNEAVIEKMILPANGVIENIPVGSYEITLTTHPNGFTPLFGVPYYEGIMQNLQITKNCKLDINCIQKNAGVRFIYDSSLQTAELTNIYPVVSQNKMTLKYNGDEKEQTGYFNPGEVSLILTDIDGTLYAIDGVKGKKLTLKSEQLWEITLKANSEEANGSITMNVRIIPVNNPTNKEDIVTGKPGKEEEFDFNLTFDGTTEGKKILNIKTHMLMSEMGFYYMERNLLNDWSEITKDKILSSGYKLSSAELQGVNSPNGKNFDLSSSLKYDVEYAFGVYIAANGKEKTQHMGFVTYESKK